MPEHSLREVVQLAGLSRHIVLRLVREGIVAPQRVRGREYRFSFQDLIVLRAARGLYAANVPPRRITAALKRLRERLPATLPLCGLRISALGADVVVHESTGRWEAHSGQLLLDFDIAATSAAPLIIERAPQVDASDATQQFELACGLEDDAPDEACAHYRQAIAADAGHLSAYINLGCLLHSLQRMDEAETLYERALAACEDKSVLWFNLGVLREDTGRIGEAMEAYRAALAIDPRMADAHYNLARLHAALGQAQEALRSFNQYRRLNPEARE